MLPRPWFRAGVALCVFALLVPALAAAAPPARVVQIPQRQSAPPTPSFWQQLAPLWAAIGCKLDPNGACLPAGAGLGIGCELDPNGRCRANLVQLDIGCKLDPDGACLPGSQ